MSEIPENPKKSKTFFVALGFLWLTGVTGYYYVSHKPFDLILLANFLILLWQIILSLGIMSLVGGLGKKLWRSELSLPLAEQVGFQFTLGFGIISGGIFLLGWLIAFNTIIAWSMTLLLLLWLWRDALDWIKQSWAAIRQFETEAGWNRAIYFLIGIIFLTAFLTALAPPLVFDSLVYHFTLPQIYLDAGQIEHQSDLVFSGFPQSMQMLSLWGMAIGLRQAALFSVYFGMLAVLGIWSMAKRIFGISAAWVGIASLMGGYTLASSLSSGYLGWAGILVGWAFILVLEHWMNTQEAKWLAILGLFTGLAAAVKYTFGILLIPGLLLILVTKKKESLPSIFRYLLWCILLIAPWLVKNTLATGNPVFPLLFPTEDMDAIRLALYSGDPAGNWLDAVFLPIRATLWGRDGVNIGDAARYQASIGPLLLGLGLLPILMGKGKSKAIRRILQICAWVAITGIAVWSINGRLGFHLSQTRLYLPLFPAFTLLAAAGFDWLENLELPNLRLGWVTSMLVVFVLSLTTLQTSTDFIQRRVLETLTGNITRQAYLEHNLGTYAEVMEELQENYGDARVLMLWETRGYYCTPICSPDETIDQFASDSVNFPNADELLRYWQSQGYTHLLFSQIGATFIRETYPDIEFIDWQLLDESLELLEIDQNFNEIYFIYSLNTYSNDRIE